MAQRFRITVHGRLSERFATRFAGLDREGGDRDTVLVGDFRDPTQLDDLLGRIADCGLVVARVEEVAPMTIDRAPGGQPARVSRRRVLGWAGATAVVAGTGLLSYRAYDTAVLDPGGGPAHAPWRDWRDLPGPAGRGRRGDPGREPAQHAAVGVRRHRPVDRRVHRPATAHRIGRPVRPGALRRDGVRAGEPRAGLPAAGLAPAVTLLPDGPAGRAGRPRRADGRRAAHRPAVRGDRPAAHQPRPLRADTGSPRPRSRRWATRTRRTAWRCTGSPIRGRARSWARCSSTRPRRWSPTSSSRSTTSPGSGPTTTPSNATATASSSTGRGSARCSSPSRSCCRRRRGPQATASG